MSPPFFSSRDKKKEIKNKITKMYRKFVYGILTFFIYLNFKTLEDWKKSRFYITSVVLIYITGKKCLNVKIKNFTNFKKKELPPHLKQLNTKRPWHMTLVGLMLFNATFNNISVISWRSVLLVEENPALGQAQKSGG